MTLHLKRPETPTVDETVELFAIDDQSYFIPSKPRMNVGLKYLKIAREENGDSATAYLLESLLGTAGWEALTEYDGLTTEEFEQIVEAARSVVMPDQSAAAKRGRK